METKAQRRTGSNTCAYLISGRQSVLIDLDFINYATDPSPLYSGANNGNRIRASLNRFFVF